MYECQLAELPVVMTSIFSTTQYQLSMLISMPFALQMKLPDRFFWGKEEKMTDVPSHTFCCPIGVSFLAYAQLTAGARASQRSSAAIQAVVQKSSQQIRHQVLEKSTLYV